MGYVSESKDGKARKGGRGLTLRGWLSSLTWISRRMGGSFASA